MLGAVDIALLRALNGLRSPALDAIAAPLGSYGYYAFPLILVVIVIVRRQPAAAAVRDGILAWFLALSICEDIVKPLFGRVRPTAVPGLRETLHVIGRVPPAASLTFPSGTAAACFAGACWIWLRWGPRAGVACVVFATLVSVSRVYAGVHYPSDILGGAALGSAVAFGVRAFSRWADRPISRR